MSTRTKRKGPIKLAVNEDTIYIRVQDCGIIPLIILCDGLPLTFFGKSKTAYLKVETALEWFEKESRYTPNNEQYNLAIAKYRQILADHRAGRLACHGG